MRRLPVSLFLPRRPVSPPYFALGMVALVSLAGCGRDESAREASGPPGGERPAPAAGFFTRDLGPPHLLAFTCGEDDHYLAIRDADAGTVRLLGPDDERSLAPRDATAGFRFADDRYVLWVHGQEQVELEIDGRPATDCGPSGRQRVLTAAYQAGYHFRASGNEPFWTLEASTASLRLSYLGRPDASFDGLTADELALATPIVRRTAAHSLLVTIREAPCRDTMSGEPSPLTVSLELDGVVLGGCGISLR